jgi:nitrite reductase/ring-hydroxylating ferredoxin subunit
MLSESENQLFTQVGPGTSGGEWLRRYWHPVATSDRWAGIQTLWNCDKKISFKSEIGTVTEFGKRLGMFSGNPTAVRILGEDLVLFRDGGGNPGLLGLQCPHRRASLEYGRIKEDGIECCYHGWKFDVQGNCIEQPAEPTTVPFRHKAYPVKEMGGILWTYLGPGEPPILPRIDVVARDDGVRALENWGLWPCNYFQIVEQTGDAAHTAVLHRGAGGERRGLWQEIPKVTWEENEYGMKTTLVRSNVTRASQFIMPTPVRLAQPWPAGKYKWPRYSGLWKIPIDDGHTLLLHVTFTPYLDGQKPELPEGLTFDVTEELNNHRWQDYEALISQGQIYDRTKEKLMSSDGNIAIIRRLVREGIEAVQRGEDPKGVWRNPEMDKILDFTRTVVDTTLMSETRNAGGAAA